MISLLTQYLEELADRDPNTYFIGIDGYSFYLFSNIQKKYPERVIGAGISEQNAISIATGLALSGKTVFVFMIAAYATRRALDQFKFACYCNARIRVITTLSGLSYPYAGFSHTAIDDVTIMKNSPNIRIYSPSTVEEMQQIINHSEIYDGPMYIAYEHCGLSYSKTITINDEYAVSYEGKGNKLCILYTGVAGYFLHNYQIIKKLKFYGASPTVYSIYKLEPLNKDKIKQLLSKYKNIVTFEIRGEGALSSSIAEIIASEGIKTNFLPIRLENEQFDVMGWFDYVADHYLQISTLDEKIIGFIYRKKTLFVQKKIKKINNKRFKIIYSFLFIPILKIKKNHNSFKKLLFGIIPLKKLHL